MGSEVGANDWVKIALADLPTASVLKQWIAESHALMSPAAKAPRKKAAKK